MSGNDTNTTIDSNSTNPITTVITILTTAPITTLTTAPITTQTTAPSKDYSKLFLFDLINLSVYSKI